MDMKEFTRRLDGLWAIHSSERSVVMQKTVAGIATEHVARGMLHSGNTLLSIKQAFEEEISMGAKHAFELLQSTHRAMGSEVNGDIRTTCHGWLSHAISEFAHSCATTSENHIRQYSGGLQNQSILAATNLSQVGGPLAAKYRILLDNYLDETRGVAETASQAALTRSTAQVDSLTGLFGRKEFDEQLSMEMQSANDRAESLALVFVDVDHFKKVNDTHGHQKGDEVLKAIGKILNSVVRGKGSAFRYGGEEMIILLPNHRLSEAIAVAERCRIEIEAARPGDIAVTASLGIGVYPDLSNTKEELVLIADKAMYDAKSRGRNLVRFHGEPEPKANDVRREPDRKQPEGGRLTSAQMEKVRKDHFQRRGAVCPDDQTPLRVLESHPVGSATPRLMISCPMCGLNEVIE